MPPNNAVSFSFGSDPNKIIKTEATVIHMFSLFSSTLLWFKLALSFRSIPKSLQNWFLGNLHF